ncbi:MAG: hypothetical protein ACOC33_01135 [bacterium]
MNILIVLPDCNYYLWQMLVQINNFRKLGIEEDAYFLIGVRNTQKSKTLMNILRHGKLKSKFFVYKDDRDDLSYSPSMTANILKKFFKNNSDLSNVPFLYIDPDVIFKEKINFSRLDKNDVWYLSDTKSYLNSKYIKSKGSELFYEMCRIVKIDPQIVISNDGNAGGAQCIIKNTTYDFWEKVENDSINLYKHMKKTENKYTPEAPIQSWTAEMWSLLWNAWLFGHKTKIIKRLDFIWATDPIKKWDNANIYHNAGAVKDDGKLFIKTKYQKSPFNQNIKCSDKYCSYNYLLEIKETEKNFKEIIF